MAVQMILCVETNKKSDTDSVCIDTDQYEKNADHTNEFSIISQYCQNKNYDLIWFSKYI